MCINCPDYVDSCSEGGCYNYDKLRSKKFYVDDEYCEHLKKKYNKSVAVWEDTYGEN